MPYESPDKKIGIVLQGPLFSPGRKPESSNISRSDLSKDDVINYIVVENISEIFHSYKDMFEIVCVTWENEDPSLLENLCIEIGEQNVFAIKDETRFVPSTSDVSGGNNKYRQFLSSLKGVEELRRRGCGYAIKARVDQKLDFLRLWEDFIHMRKYRPKSVLVPWVWKSKPDVLIDFFFCAEVDLLEHIFYNYLHKPELFSGVHRDIFYRWSESLYAPPFMKMYFLYRTPFFYSYILKMHNIVFCPASKEVYDTIFFRGYNIKLYQFDKHEKIFIEDLSENLYVNLSGYPMQKIHRRIVKRLQRLVISLQKVILQR